MSARGVAACIVSCVLGIVFQLAIIDRVDRRFSPEARLLVTAKVEEGTQFEVFLNGRFDTSYRAPIRKGDLHTYEFKNVPGNITFIRLDPTDSPDTSVELHKIELVVGDQPAGMISAAELQRWAPGGAELTQLPTPGSPTLLRTRTNDPILVGTSLTLGAARATVSSIDWIARHLLWIITGVAVLVLCSARAHLSFLGTLIVGAGASVGIGILVSSFSGSLHWMADPGTAAIGAANYAGHPKSREKVIYFATLLLVAALGAGLGLLIRRLRNVSPSPNVHTARPFSWRFVVATIIGVSFILFPDIDQHLALLSTPRHDVNDFDYNNIVAWEALFNFGFLPHRDYWFPYGGYFDQLGFLPGALLRDFFSRVVLLAVLVISVYQLSGRKILLTSGILTALALPIHTGMFLGTKRYLLSLLLVLAHLALLSARARHAMWYVSFGAFVGWTVVMEANQLLYAAPALALSTGIWWWGDSPDERQRLMRSSVITGSTVLCTVIAYLFVLYLRGQLGGFMEFYRNMPAAAVSSATPADISAWFTDGSLSSVVLIGLLATLFSGVVQLLVTRDRSPFLAQLGLSITGCFVFLKLLLRPGMGNQVLLFPCGALLFGFFRTTRPLRLRQACALLLLIGLYIGSLERTGVVRQLVTHSARHLISFPMRASSMAVALQRESTLSEQLFSPSSFTGWRGGADEAIQWIRGQGVREWESNIYVLGSQSNFYLVLRQKPPRYLTFYDGGNIAAQNEVIGWLEERRPRFVIFDRTASAFDSVPNVVRVPLIFSYIPRHYQHVASFGKYDILERSDAMGQVQWEYWVDRLGQEIDLRAVPALAHTTPRSECTNSSPCRDVADIRVDTAPPSRTLTIPIRIEGRTFTATFTVLEGVNDYRVALDRLWFVNLARSVGLAVSIPERIETVLVRAHRVSSDEPELYF